MPYSKDDESFKEYLSKVNIQEVLLHAGYIHNRRDGLRYPSYVRLDNDGRRIKGDKFIVNPNTNTCYHPPVIKNYNVISLITEHPDMFPEKAVNPYRLVHDVCRSILGLPPGERSQNIVPIKEAKPFSLDAYDLKQFDETHVDGYRSFYPYFHSRGIDFQTQKTFKDYFLLATKTGENGKTFTSLAFPMLIAGKDKTVVGFEQRGRPRMDGSSGYKGMALGSNASEGMWIANLGGRDLSNVKDVFWFESAYDAMAYYQLNRNRRDVRKGVFVSTAGNPALNQMYNLLNTAPQAKHHIAFDNDLAGEQFARNLETIAKSVQNKLNEGKEQGKLKDLGIYDVPEWALCMIENGEKDNLDDKEIEVAEKFLDEHFPEGFVMEVDWDNPNEFNRYPSFGTKVEHPFGHGESPYLAVKTYLAQFYHPSKREGMVDIQTVRESPSDGTKDWNESLLKDIEEKREQSEEKQASGIDIDGNGEIEISESEEKKRQVTHSHGR